MSDLTIDYGKLIDEAMHIIVQRTLKMVEKSGLPGEHHFFISFLTSFPGVMMSDELKKKYPEEMTIVLQHQFWDLEVEEGRFSVVLSFNNVKHNLTVPFASIVSFADPSVKFGLQFRHAFAAEENEGQENAGPVAPSANTQEQAPVRDGSNIVALDSFRKKNNKKK